MVLTCEPAADVPLDGCNPDVREKCTSPTRATHWHVVLRSEHQPVVGERASAGFGQQTTVHQRSS